MRYAVHVRGSGRTELAAYGVADAEHQVEKQILRLWPDARVHVREVRRTGSAERIAEEFAVEYRIDGWMDVEAADAEAARREAFRCARERLAGSRYWTVAWDRAEVSKAGRSEGEA